MDKGNAVGQGGMRDESMGCGGRRGWGEIEVPEAGVAGAGAGEQQRLVAMNVEASG
jgi:hypothetical protein